MGSGGLQRLYDAVVVIIGVGIDFGEPNHFLGVHGLAVNHGADLPVRSAGIEADAAALKVAAHLLRGIVVFGNLVHQQNLEGMLEHVCHVVPVKFLLAAGTVDAAQVVINHFVAADINAEAALHPQDELYQAVNVEAVSFLHFRRTVNKGVEASHFTLCSLHSDGHRLPGICQKGLIEQMQGDEPGVKLRAVLDIHIYSKKFHKRRTSFVNFGDNCIVT